MTMHGLLRLSDECQITRARIRSGLQEGTGPSADAAREGGAGRPHPYLKFLKLLVVEDEPSAAARAGDRAGAVAAGFAPLQEIAVGVAPAVAEMRDDRLDAGAEKGGGLTFR